MCMYMYVHVHVHVDMYSTQPTVFGSFSNVFRAKANRTCSKKTTTSTLTSSSTNVASLAVTSNQGASQTTSSRRHRSVTASISFDVVDEGKRKLMTSAANGEGHCFNVLRCDLGGGVGGCHCDICC